MDFIAEIALEFGWAGAGYAIGAAVFAVVRAARWALLRTDRTTVVTDPLGARWTVRVPLAPARLKFPISKQLFRMRSLDRVRRGSDGVAPDGVAATELAHPSALTTRMDALAPIVALVMLAVFLLALAAFFVELIIVVVIAAVVGGLRMLWGRWQCEVIAPSGTHSTVTAGSLTDARVKCTTLAESIASGGGIDLFVG